MKRSTLPPLFLILSFYLTSSIAGADGIADMGRQFLLVPQGARESAMGGSFASISDSAMGVFCNPAALVQVKESELSLTHLSWFGGANEESAAYVRPIGDTGVLGSGLSLYWIHPFDNTGGVENPFSAVSYEGLVGGARSLPDLSRVSIGGSLRYTGMDLGGMEQTTDLSMDLGVFYKTDWEPLRLGAVVESVSLLTTAGTSPPLSFRVGASLKSKDSLFALEAIRMQGQNWVVQAGAEYWLYGIALRGGLTTNDSAGSFLVGSLGVGFQIENDYRLDYAASSMGDLGLVQWISLGLLFGSPERAAGKPAPSIATAPSPEDAPAYKKAMAVLPKGTIPPLAPPYRKSFDIFQDALSPNAAKSGPPPIPKSYSGIDGFPLSVDVVSNKVEMSWIPQKFEGTPAVGYNVYVSIVPGANFKKLNDKPIQETHWSAEMGLHGITYYFLITAVGPNGAETKNSEIKDVLL